MTMLKICFWLVVYKERRPLFSPYLPIKRCASGTPNSHHPFSRSGRAPPPHLENALRKTAGGTRLKIVRLGLSDRKRATREVCCSCRVSLFKRAFKLRYQDPCRRLRHPFTAWQLRILRQSSAEDCKDEQTLQRAHRFIPFPPSLTLPQTVRRFYSGCPREVEP